MLSEAERVENAAQRPHVHLEAHLVLPVEIDHLRSAVARCRVLGHALLLLDDLPPAALRRQHSSAGRAEIAQHVLVRLRAQHVLHLQVPVRNGRALRVHGLHACHDALEDLEHPRLRQGRPPLELAGLLAFGVEQVDERAVRAKLQQHPVLPVRRVGQQLATRPKVADDARLSSQLLEHLQLHLCDASRLLVLREHLLGSKLPMGWLGLPRQVHERVAALGQQCRRRDLVLLASELKLQRDRSVADTQRLLQPVHGRVDSNSIVTH